MSAVENCVICADRITEKVDCDEVAQLLTSFWALIGIDEKPRDHKACKACAYELEELAATLEARGTLKKNLGEETKKLQADLATGLEKRRKNKIPFLEVHTKIEASVKDLSLKD